MRNPNGYGTVIKLKGNRRLPYVAKTNSMVLNGKAYAFYISYFSTQKEAKICLERYNEDINFRNAIINKNIERLGLKPNKKNKEEIGISKINTKDIDPKDIPKNINFNVTSTIEEVFENLKIYKSSELSESTIKNYNSSYRAIIDIKDLVFAELSAKDLIQIVKDHNMTYSTALKYKTLMGQMYELAILQGIVKTNYAALLTFRKSEFDIKNSRDISVFTKDEINLLWNKKDDLPFLKYILFMIYTGVRTNELLNIKNSDIDLDSRTILIKISKTNAGKNRKIPIAGKILPIVKELMNPYEYFVINSKNEQMKYDNFQRDNFKKSLNLIGLEHRPHDTRHTFVSMINRLDINEAIISKIVGHKSSAVTLNTYTHKEISDLINAIDKLEGDL